MRSKLAWFRMGLCAVGVAVTGCTPQPVTNPDHTLPPASAAPSSPAVTASPLPWPGPAVSGGAITKGLVPLPALAESDPAETFQLSPATRIWIGPDHTLEPIADDLAAALRPATGFSLPIDTAPTAPANAFLLALDNTEPQLGTEGYDLSITRDAVRLVARTPEGLFHGIQTIRQLLPARIEARTPQPGPWHMIGGRIVDYPRFAYRGAMLDVARHFFPVADVERYIDELALYKVNVLHLHLSDDQGWRIAIDSWPKLAPVGGKTEVGGGPGGYYTQADYRAIVAYAQAHFITVVPEIETPGHVNAALVAYPQLACSGKPIRPYTGTGVGFSSLCISNPTVYQFVDDVVGELAALTPGPYIHLGGDEAMSTPPSEYAAFVQKAQAIVEAHGKTLMGWAEIAKGSLDASAVAEYWNFRDGMASARQALARGMRLVAAPADHAYLDQKYTATSRLGLTWAGPVSVAEAYAWDPTMIAPDGDVLGVEAPLWSETIRTMADIEYLAWPRMAGIAEIGWTPQSERSWQEYRLRLAAQGPRWQELGVNFYPSPEVPWPTASTNAS
ncbi:beta-N-acetylhexosaminidase [Acidothermus cellulolyticus 11B]|uniref:beta-N-acetylhexosaminidase n=1 Tax=Acidothermus cellulolyticus (strain ATCC 43068 / DSM 8971 / 11B) TaxID=351607 RepID=A0LQY8_ACIC1|nr:beta-N-acetylhexosaminidase [Acidothermus cellulolyticus]ABK51848.1 beta-N-acetylhexosaminidase [Acidothermus cellulolyticus 11B]